MALLSHFPANNHHRGRVVTGEMEEAMRLIIAWVVSGFAGNLTGHAGLWPAGWFLGAPSGWYSGVLRGFPYFFAFCLVFQLVYGGLLCLVLGALGWRNLPVVLLGYVIPIGAFVWMGADVPKDIAMEIPKLTCGVGLAIVG
jgi:hypothetical protein